MDNVQSEPETNTTIEVAEAQCGERWATQAMFASHEQDMHFKRRLALELAIQSFGGSSDSFKDTKQITTRAQAFHSFMSRK
jgi:hypothetical protein